MAEYIEREAALKILEKSLLFCESELETGEYRKGCIAAIQDDIGNIKHLPAADVVEVVRCKDCKWWHKETECLNPNGGYGFLPNGEWFCASGQRKEGG